jgi:hypothetical protein
MYRGATYSLDSSPRAKDVTITEEVVKAAAGNRESGKVVMSPLLKRKGNNV